MGFCHSRLVILYRGQEFEENEKPAAEAAGFFCTPSRMDIKPGDLVIGRYSVLPFYAEQEHDINLAKASLLTSYAQHSYVADVGAWSADLAGITPTTWRSLADVPFGEPGPFVLKGETNSRKFQWATQMYAKDRAAASAVLGQLCVDSLIGQQNIYVRKFVPLVTFTHGINDLPITREFRFFVCDGIVLSGGYYWSSHLADLPADVVGLLDPTAVPAEVLQQAIDRIGRAVRFYAIDIAQAATGEWLVIEINDAQMSGLSENLSETLYNNLAKVLTGAQHACL